MKNKNETKTEGLALICDLEGNIREVLLDDFNLRIPEGGKRVFSSLVDTASRNKSLNFLLDIKKQQITFDYQLNLLIGHEIKTLYFLGIKLNGSLLLIGADNHKEAVEFTNRLQQINNEQANLIRQLMKGRIQKIHESEREEEHIFDEISRLNNDLVNLQRELTKKNHQLENLNSLKNRFIGMAAHDLRNPLNVILSYSEFLLMEAEEQLSQEHKDFLETIKISTYSMLALIEDLLDYSRIESGKLELNLQKIDFIQQLRRNITLNQVLAKKKQVEIFLHSSADQLLVAFDPDKIDQVLNNLISNAVKFSEEGRSVDIHVLERPKHLEVRVVDTGIGIPEDKQDLLFRPFSKIDSGTGGEKGTGLGLVIVKRIIEGHKGSIWLESEPGEGTTFYFTLPYNETVVS